MAARKPRRPCKQCGNAVPYHRVSHATAAEHYCFVCVPRSSGAGSGQRNRAAILSLRNAISTLPGLHVVASYQITKQHVARIAQGKR